MFLIKAEHPYPGLSPSKGKGEDSRRRPVNATSESLEKKFPTCNKLQFPLGVAEDFVIPANAGIQS